MMRFAVLALIVGLAAPAGAQSALKHHNTDAPLDVDAKSIDVLDAKGQAVWSGDVHITQGDMKLDADTVTVFYSRRRRAAIPSSTGSTRRTTSSW